MLHILINSSNSKKDPNIKYLSGYSPDFCMLAYDDISDKKCMFVVPFEINNYNGIKCYPFDLENLRKKLLGFFKRRTIKKIGVNNSFISLNELKRLKKLLPGEYVDNSKSFLKKRLRKTKEELEWIGKACKLTDLVFEKMVSLIRKGKLKTERDVFLFIKKQALEYDTEIAFDSVVATSSNAAKPHHISTNKKLNGFTIIDFGLRYKGYCSDCTRTIYVGNPSAKEIENYNLVLNAYNNAMIGLKKGVSLKEADSIARKMLGRWFVHSLGHGLGVEIHELPTLSPKSKYKLEEGIAFTVEPGIYHKDKYGIRIEDTVAFVSSKIKVLTKSKKDLIVIRKNRK